MRKIIQPWWIRKQIALTVARLPSWGLRCCRPKEPLSEPRRGEFRRRAANRRANRTGNAACQEIVFGSSWRYILHISFLKAHLLALRTRSIPRSKELGQLFREQSASGQRKKQTTLLLVSAHSSGLHTDFHQLNQIASGSQDTMEFQSSFYTFILPKISGFANL